MRKSVRDPSLYDMTTQTYDLNQLHNDLLEQLELSRHLLDATEFLADSGEAHELASDLFEALADTQAALSSHLREEN